MKRAIIFRIISGVCLMGCSLLWFVRQSYGSGILMAVCGAIMLAGACMLMRRKK